MGPVLVRDDLVVAAAGLLDLPVVLAVVVINNPAAVFLELAELSLLVDGVIEVLARVILGPEEETTVFGNRIVWADHVGKVYEQGNHVRFVDQNWLLRDTTDEAKNMRMTLGCAYDSGARQRFPDKCKFF